MVTGKNRIKDHELHYGPDVSTSEIESDIDRTRHEMDETIDELAERLHPRHLLGTAAERVARALRSPSGDGGDYSEMALRAGKTIAHQVREHPIPALLFGAGLAWLAYDQAQEDEGDSEPRMDSGSYGPRTAEPHDGRGSGEGAAARAKEKLSEAAEGVKEAASRAGEKAREWTSEARETAGRTAQRARRRSGRLASQIRNRARSGAERSREGFSEALDEYPLAVGAAFAALGVFVGLALPRTEVEDKWMGERSDEFEDEAKSKAREMVDRGRETAKAAVAAATEEAERQGIAPDQLATKAREAMEKSGEVVKEALHEEGIAPGDLKEKSTQVAERAQTEGREQAQRHKEEMSS